MELKNVVLVDGVRSAFARGGRGALVATRLDDAGATVLRALMERNPKVKLTMVEDIGLGNVGGAGELAGIGGDTVAIEKVAELAGISSYELVDVNSRVRRKANETLRWVFDPLLLDFQNLERQPQTANTLDPAQRSQGFPAEGSFGVDGLPILAADTEALREILPYGGVGLGQAEALPGFPRRVNHPNIYYLYVGPSQ